MSNLSSDFVDRTAPARSRGVTAPLRGVLLLCLGGWMVLSSGGCSSAPLVAAKADGTAPVVVKERTSRDFAIAVEALRAGRHADAERLFTELTVDEPSMSGPWVNLGVIHRERGDLDAAEAAFKRAVEINGGNATALNELGVIARQRGDFLTAEANYLEAIQVAPAAPDAYLNLGILYELYLGRFNDALEAYRTFQTLSVSPNERVQGWVSDLERRLVAGRAS